ncbi:haloacid dehalogenase superfamily, subfamily IA, variant 3 with third motif having DD or ED/beta-phosphoglucomutase family hydrolase [Marivirga sericea]|uniref:Beta-phosphoglucomutase n=1 Tax=Marivirga sericea TaxID=1028 RepID=A0A1X7L1F9_9BACT|nr:HAD family phosphatase [Marivirga sericea]SMG47354.1 haloacid dehalogenase superfamily, subfamily IA, variant 3 with third motif having DD or ED/beta-phosphoglucomutase family hydrolase [Marivirga sericea]
MHNIFSQKKAIIFDMDGVIVNNISYHIEALKQFLKQFGKEVTEEEFQSHYNGRTIQEVILELKPEADHIEVMNLAEEKEQIYRDLYKAHLAPTPGLEKFLELAQQAGLQMAVATSAITANADFTLDGLNIRKYFSAVIDSTMVIKGKPDPQIYLKAAAELNISPENCVVLEDALAGIQSAKSAGMDVLGLYTSLKKEELPDGLLMKIKDFNELNEQF